MDKLIKVCDRERENKKRKEKYEQHNEPHDKSIIFANYVVNVDSAISIAQ